MSTPMEVSSTVSDVHNFIDSILRTEELEAIFTGYIVESSVNEECKIKNYEEQMTALIKSCDTPEKIELMLRDYLNGAGSIPNVNKVRLLLSMLEHAINNHLLSAKSVCEAILNCEHLHINKQIFFCQSFELIHRVISQVDYKGVRDIIRFMIEKIHTIPIEANIAMLPQLDVMRKVLDYALNRNSSLLPAYLAFDEIKKKSDKWMHWKFADLFSAFVESFRPVAQMVSIINRSKLLPIVGYSSTLNQSWQLNAATAAFDLKGLLPYNNELTRPQIGLLRYVLEQPYSREMIYFMLSLTNKAKSRCPILEEQLVALIVLAMEKSENETNNQEDTDYSQTQCLWQILSGHLITFIILNHISFPQLVRSLHESLAARNSKKGRDHLMWMLLQYISGSIQKTPLTDFLPFFKLHDLLYPEKDPLPVPDITKPICTHTFAISSIWIHLLKKAENEPQKMIRPIPNCLRLHVEFLHQTFMSSDLPASLTVDSKIPLICNAYSTNSDYYNRILTILCDTIKCNSRSGSTGGNTNGAIIPLSVSLLDSVTLHTKMSLISNIVAQINKSSSKDGTIISPALAETYSRLLIYIELETLGIKNFIQQVIPNAIRTQSWGTLNILFEMFIHRLHHIPAPYRVQFLNQLHYLANSPHSNQIQLHSCMESTALKLITGFTSEQVLLITQLNRYQNEPKIRISHDSEELNKVLILTLARAIHVTGCDTLIEWCKELLSNIMNSTPLAWSSCTLKCFPPAITEYYQNFNTVTENKAQLKQSVEEEYRKWITMSNENDIIAHFSIQGTPPLFLCLLWKMILENDRINPIAYKILDRIGAKALSSHLRILVDYLVNEFTNLCGTQNVTKYIDKLNDLIWKSHVITLDRLLLCLTLRAYEGNEAQVSLFIIQMLLLKTTDFSNRVADFVREMSPEHWKQSNWHEKHHALHRKYPEKFYFEGLADISGQNMQHSYLPTYFSNICLRFIPVLDLIIHRYLELPPGSPSPLIDSLLEKYGCLYKFHDRPLTYLYETLHYYEHKMRERPALRRKLVSIIIGAFKDIKPANWAVTDAYLNYMKRPVEDLAWNPELDYYFKLISRVVDTFQGKSPFPHVDWRFNEFANAGVHALHITCIELMALPVAANVVANNLIDLVVVGHKYIPRNTIEFWNNAIGVVLTALPEAYWSVINDRIISMMESPLLTYSPHPEPFQMMNFSDSHKSMSEMQPSYLIALIHSFFHHASIGQITPIPQFLRERVKPIIKTEEQFLFIVHIVCPFLQRLYAERTRRAMEVTIELYSFLEVIDKNCTELRFMDTITDLLYHMKYHITGDSIKNDVEGKIRNLRPALQKRLRFITHLNIETTT
ncbi:mediator of RNA polymerase II transcription subunit 23 [Tetranychus urticae]|uniref:mediator of RNA polymerase II transcription subunit 23 n=1 Tax=Tetranychus urticae TaxID=32264 RepID=UPI00077BED16|nr:mediator of RNA polymerase II transcription subunit 23 [Tetranychus urticae]